MAFFNLNQKQLGTNDYLVEQDPNAEKKKKIFIGAGIGVLVIALILIFTSGGAKPGQVEMKAALTPLSEALGITTTYEKNLSYTPTKNDVSLIKTLLRSNYPALNDLYKTTFNPKGSFPTNPKPDDKSIEVLDTAAKNNTLDNEIINALQPKIDEAGRNLQKAKTFFTKDESVTIIETALDDLSSINDILNRAR